MYPLEDLPEILDDVLVSGDCQLGLITLRKHSTLDIDIKPQGFLPDRGEAGLVKPPETPRADVAPSREGAKRHRSGVDAPSPN